MKRYALDQLVTLYLGHAPGLTPQEAGQRALALRRELQRLDRNWTNSERRYRILVAAALSMSGGLDLEEEGEEEA